MPYVVIFHNGNYDNLVLLGVVTVLEGREAIMSVSVGRETEGSFFRCTLIELALSILYVDPCSLDEEEHTDMASTSDSYPSLWCSITSEGRGGHVWRGGGVWKGRREGRYSPM